jgi:ribosomal protein S18 acetylase RimI-like enzyme
VERATSTTGATVCDAHEVVGARHEWTVREATAADADRIGTFLHTIWGEAGPSAPGFSGATPELIDEIAAPDAVRARLGGPARRIMIAVSGDDVIGFAASRRRADDVELAGIVVRRAWAGRGVGSELVRGVVEVCRRDGTGTITVRTETDNATAIAFYESLGFVRRGEDLERVGETDVAVVELALAI